jgi:glycosyltransferase involved in cell wall biosynthesis
VPQETPLVSIITPAYNRARELPETIESVLAQTYPNIEYIVLDDGSTDATSQVLQRYGSRLRVERHANMGEARTVNRGWSIARGELIATVNSDDPVLPEFVARAVAFMQAKPDVLVGYPDWAMIDDTGRVIRHVQVPEYDAANMVRWSCCMPGPGAVMRRRVLELAGQRNPEFRYVGDFEFWLRASRHGRFARIPYTLAQWRNHEDATTNTAAGPRMAAELVRIVHAYFAAPDLPPEIRASEAEALAVACYVAGTQCLEAGAIGAARRYYLRSLYYHPHSTEYPTGLKRSVSSMLSHIVLPVPVRRLLKKALLRPAAA